MRGWQKLFAQTIIFMALAYVIEGFYVSSFGVALGASIILSVLNISIRPVLSFLSIPITLVTLGFWSLVLNAFMLYIVAFFLSPAFSFTSFWPALLVAGLMSLINSFIERR